MGRIEDSWRHFRRGLDAAATSMAQGAHALVPVGTWPTPRIAEATPAAAMPEVPGACTQQGATA